MIYLIILSPIILVLIVAILYFLGVFIFSKIVVNNKQDESKDIKLYILTNGVHTDIVMPVRSKFIDWSTYFKIENTKKPDFSAQYIAIGWGDKGFYLQTPTWAELKPSVALKAIFWLSSSAIHATYYSLLKEDENCKSFYVSEKQYQLLVKNLLMSLQTDENNEPICIVTDAVYGDNDAFYEANETYSLFLTCNTWTNNKLKQAGLKALLWTPFSKPIMKIY